MAPAFHTWIFNEGLMNNSEKQAAAFEPKWTCEEPETRQTLTATVHPHRSKAPGKHILISVYSPLHIGVCLQMNHFLNERMIEASQSSLVSPLLSYSVKRRTPDWKSNKNRDGVDGYSLISLSNTLSMTLAATHCSISQILFPYFLHPSISPPFSCFHLSTSLTSIDHSISLSLLSTLSFCYCSFLDSG